MNKSLAILEKMKKVPFGLRAFSRIVCLKAPYFSSINPVFTRLEAGYGEATLRKRRAVSNHLGTVHAIAMANLCEFVAGTTIEVSLPNTHRWIPKSMQINYLKKAETDVTAKLKLPLDAWPDAGPVIAQVDVFDRQGNRVVNADIEMYVSLKKKS